MMKTNHIMLAAAVLIGIGMLTASAANDSKAQLMELDEAVGRIQAQVRRICEDADSGKLTKEVKLTFGGKSGWLKEETLTFGARTLDRDLDRALDLLEKYEKMRAEIVAESRGRKSAPGKAVTLEERMRQAESETASGSGDTFRPGAPAFSVLDDFSEGHKARQAEKDRMAEADMMRVAEERKLAEQEKNIEKEKKRQIDEQNRRWQAQLDAEATKDAEQAAEWKRTHGAGAFVKGLVRTVVGGTVTAFTGGVARGVGSGFADAVIRDRFPEYAPHDRHE
jgi:hypothetical protein